MNAESLKKELKEKNGPFSFVKHEEETDTWYFACDRFGAKPLYFAVCGKTPVFAESIGKLRENYDLPARFREDLLEVYLSFTYLPGEETFFEGVRKALPGYLYTCRDGRVIKERYFTPAYHLDEKKTEEEWTCELEKVLDEIFIPEEKGITALLSSGIDSNYLCTRLSAKNTYTAVYEEEGASEAEGAKENAERIGSEHHEVSVTPEQFFMLAGDAMEILGQPTGDASAPVLLALDREIAKEEKVCYSGEGIDELFMGYYYGNLYKILETGAPQEAGYLGTTEGFSEAEKNEILKDYAGTKKAEFTAEAYALSKEASGADQGALVDMLVWMNGNLLPNVTLLASSCGLTMKMPYLDNRLYDLSLRIPASVKCSKTETKRIFRKAAEKVIGADAAAKPKRGFPVPVSSWMRLPENISRIRAAFSSPAAEKFFRTEKLSRMLGHFAADPGDRDSWRPVWTVYSFLLWYDRVVEPGILTPHWQVWDPRFNQKEAWTKTEFPGSTLHWFRKAGCLVTALATLLRHYGIEKEADESRFDPWIFSERLKRIRGFDSNADLYPESVWELYPLEFTGREPYSEKRLEALLSAGTPCLVKVTGVSAPYHFVLPVALQKGEVRIIDSGWDKEYLSQFEHVYEIYKFRRTDLPGTLSSGEEKRERVIRKALSFIGVRESAEDANDVIFNTDYYGKEVFGPQYKWCVAFLWDVFRLAGASESFYDGKQTARCVELLEWAKNTGRLIDLSEVRRGDILLYDWYRVGRPVHAGLVLSGFDREHFRTIEGNTSDPKAVHAPGEVMIQRRGYVEVCAAIRIDWE